MGRWNAGLVARTHFLAHVVQVFFRRRVAVIDQITPALQIGLTLKLIGVERRFVEYFG